MVLPLGIPRRLSRSECSCLICQVLEGSGQQTEISVPCSGANRRIRWNRLSLPLYLCNYFIRRSTWTPAKMGPARQCPSVWLL